MDKGRLLGKGVETFISRNAQLRHESDEDSARRVEIKRTAEQLFSGLEARNEVVIDAVKKLTKPSIDLNYLGAMRKRLTVVIGRHDQTELTPDHLSICRISCINNRPGDGQQYIDWGATAEFAFGIVPSQLVGIFMQWPQEVTNKYKYNLISESVEESMSAIDIRDCGKKAVLSSTSRLTRSSLLADVEYAVNTVEENMAMVTEAIADPDLNPRLYYEGSEIPSYPFGT